MWEKSESRNPIDFVDIALDVKKRKAKRKAISWIVNRWQSKIEQILKLHSTDTPESHITHGNRDSKILERVADQSRVVPTNNSFIDNKTIPEGIEGEQVLVSIDKKTLIIVPQELVTKYPFASICQWKQEILLERLRRLDFSDRKRALLEFPEWKISIKNGDTIHEITLDQRVSIWDIETSLNLYIPWSPLFH